MSLAVYDKIRDFYGTSGAANIPAGKDGVFFGFAGCDRDALETALIDLRTIDPAIWINADNATRGNIFARIAWDVSASTGASYDGLIKWLNWAYVAANGDGKVKSWFEGGEFTTLDYWAQSVVDKITDTAAAAVETVEYGLQQTQGEKAILYRILPVLGILGACYIVKKVLD